MAKSKDSTEKTRVGRFLTNLGPVASPILEAIGGLTGLEALTRVGEILRKPAELIEITEEDRQIALALVKADLEDRKDARQLQRTSLDQDDKFSKRFLYYLTMFIVASAVAFIFITIYVPYIEQVAHIVDTSYGILIGTVFVSVINYFF